MRRRLEPSVVRWLTLAAALVAFLSSASAQPIPREDLPPELRSWVPWVLDPTDPFPEGFTVGDIW